jgi:hypothetical protein
MHVSELKESKFLRKEDCGAGILVTIDDVRQENVAKEGAPEDMKWCMYFKESEKPMVLNSTNGQIIAQFTGAEESDDWIGVQVVLYHDPNVSFGGKLVGGIRVRAPRKPGVPATGKKPVAMPRAKPAAEADNDEATPF